MIVFTHIFLASAGFIIGFILGAKGEKPTQKYKFETDEDTAQLQREFENFLSYDGSVQE